jgi:type II secretory pathway pseudopilin PulG
MALCLDPAPKRSELASTLLPGLPGTQLKQQISEKTLATLLFDQHYEKFQEQGGRTTAGFVLC